MKLFTPSPRRQTSSKSALPSEAFDPKTAGYIRLLGAILDEPAERIARQLSAGEAIVQALAIENDQTAA
jgi:hypothetical protein